MPKNRYYQGPVSDHFDGARFHGPDALADKPRGDLWKLYRTPDGAIYHIGDTAWRDGAIFREVPLRFGSLRLAILPIGAYEPRWFMRNQHVDPDESVAIFEACAAHHARAHHWGTFRLTAEPIDAPPRRLAKALARQGIDAAHFSIQRPGEAFDVPPI